MGTKRCLACGDPLPLSSRVPDQSYCSRAQCQRERLKLWQREKKLLDPAYRETQAIAQKAWAERISPLYQADAAARSPFNSVAARSTASRSVIVFMRCSPHGINQLAHPIAGARGCS